MSDKTFNDTEVIALATIAASFEVTSQFTLALSTTITTSNDDIKEKYIWTVSVLYYL